MDSPGRTVYDRIGTTYAARRTSDPRWEREILAALGPAETVINIGAGTGSYEPKDRRVLAVEPSTTMIEQRSSTAAPVVQASAEALPVGDQVFDVAMAILTVHHWTDQGAGLAEMRRVARRQVVLTFDAEVAARFWLCDYIPEIAQLDRERAPAIDTLLSTLQTDDIRTVRVPFDMRDGVLAANWRRPAAYLDPLVRQCASGLAQLDQYVVEAGIGRLASDLRTGAWERDHGQYRSQTTYDGGYRLIVARTPHALPSPEGELRRHGDHHRRDDAVEHSPRRR